MLRSLPPVVTFNKTLPNIKNILLMNTGIFLLFMKIFKKLLGKKRSFPIDETGIYTK